MTPLTSAVRSNFCQFIGRSLVSLLLLLLFSGMSVAQTTVTDGYTPQGLSPGSPSGSYSLGGFENVNLFNGNLNFALPLLGIGGRGGAGYQITRPIEHKWVVERFHDEFGDYYSYFPGDTWEQWNDPGYGAGSLHARYAGVGDKLCPRGNGLTEHVYLRTLTRLTFTMPGGTEFELRDQQTGGQPYILPTCANSGYSRGRVFITADGSSATFISDTDIVDVWKVGDAGWASESLFPSGYLMLRDGTRYRIDGGIVTWLRDRNGNRLSFTYSSGLGGSRPTTITDSLNRQVNITYNRTGVPYDEITFKGFGGVDRTIRLNYASLGSTLRTGFSLQTYKQLFPELDGSSTTNYDPSMLSSITLPDGRSYTFSYNSYGELARVVLPTGGAIEYDYAAGFSNGYASGAVNFGGVLGGAFDWEVYRRVIERRTYSDGVTLESRMTYSRPESGVGSSLGYVVVDQKDAAGALLGRQKHYFFGSAGDSLNNTAINQPLSYPGWKEGKEYKSETLGSDGSTVLRRVENTFEQRAAISWWQGTADSAPSLDPRLTQAVMTLADTNQVSQQTFAYDQFNNQTDVYDYDYGAGAPGALVRRTHIDYLTSNPVNGIDYTSTSVHIRSLPTQQQVFDAAGVERARATYEYDNYTSDTYHSPLIDRPGISGMDSAFNSSYGTRGNATSVSRWLLSNGTSINTYAQYDVAGNSVKAIDGRGQVSQAEYSSSYQYAYPTSATSPIPDPTGVYGTSTALVTTSVYDFSTGLITTSTDANGKTTTVQYNDVLDRPTTILRPDGGRTTYTYVDVHQCGPYVETRTLLDTSGRETDDYVFFDGLGRSVRAFKYDGQDSNNPYLTTDTQYDSLGRVRRVSNPYRSPGCTAAINPSGNWTTTAYDALGRVLTVTTPDSAVVSSSYNGNQVTVTDQKGKSRRSVTDALGRLSQVIEDPNALAYQTNYSYDVLGNLSTVAQDMLPDAQHPQGVQQRRYFMYDSLSRLIRAKNPEQDANASIALSDPLSGNSQWSMAYGYDSNGNLATRTDARGITATYVYDNLNRNTQVNYSDGSHVNRVYDISTNGRGRLNYAASYPASGIYSLNVIDSYDAMGRPLYQHQHFWANGSWGTAYITQRAYNLAGNVTSQTYPSGRVVNYTYDQSGRTNTFTGNLGDGVTRTYAASITYDEWSGLSREQFGTDTPLYHKEHRNVRGQLYDMLLSTVNDDGNYNRGAIVNYYSLQVYGRGASGPDNNGNVVIQQHRATTDDAGNYALMQQNYDYDVLNRISWVGEYQGGATNTGAQNYSYDRYGNRTMSGWGTGINNQQFAVDANNNRICVPSGQSGVMQYDQNGNLTNDTYSGAGTRTYDAENRMVSATNNAGQQSIYTYDGDGRRVRRQSYGQETWQAYGMEGELLAEYGANTAPSTPQKEYGYRNGELLITATAQNRINVALASNGAVATASSTTSESEYPGMTFPASGVIDGDHKGLNWEHGGGWRDGTANTYPDWLQVSFNGSKSISEIDVFTIQDNYSNPVEPTEAQTFSLNGITDFDVQYWNGTSWITVTGGSVTANNKVWRKFTFSAITTDKVRVLVNNALNSQSRLVEVEAWQGAESSSNGVDIEWMVSDQLGTPRMIADKSGSLAGIKRHDYLPFGEELFAGTGGRTQQQGYSQPDGNRKKWAKLERDDETGLDYAEARYYSSAQGRFTSVDPENYQAMQDLSDPQSWNAYTYVNNNPLRRVDPDGRGFWTKLANLVKWGVWGEEEDVQAEELRRRRILQVRSDEQMTSGYVIVQNADGTVQALRIYSLSRDQVWSLSTQATNGEAGSIPHDVAENVIRNMPAAIQPPVELGGTKEPNENSPSKGADKSLPPSIRNKLGNLASRADETVSDVIRSRGGTGANVKEAGHWAQKTLREAGQAAINGDATAVKAIKIAKGAGRLGQKH